LAEEYQFGATQYLREVKLLVVDTSVTTTNPQDITAQSLNPAIDLSALRIKFSVKRSDTMTPNMADIRVYNLDEKTALQISKIKNFARVILQAGYKGNFGVIFQGNVKQVILGRESATDTFIDIIAGDGDRAYNFAVVNTTLAAGSRLTDQINAAINPMIPKGVSAGQINISDDFTLPRGKVMFGNSRNYLRSVASTSKNQWSIQDEKVTFVPVTSYLPGEAVVMNSLSGLIGTPQQTNEGVNVKCLINPRIAVGGRIKIDNKTVIEQIKVNLGITNPSQFAASIPALLRSDGVYYVLVAEHQGDTRGVEWYSTLICLNVDVTTNPLNAVSVGYG
jgi:hypothetical protein